MDARFRCRNGRVGGWILISVVVSVIVIVSLRVFVGIVVGCALLVLLGHRRSLGYRGGSGWDSGFSSVVMEIGEFDGVKRNVVVGIKKSTAGGRRGTTYSRSYLSSSRG